MNAMTPHAVPSLSPYQRDAALDTSFVMQTNQWGVVQRKEIWEFFGFETRNKYSIHMPDGSEVAFCAEQGKGFFAALFRQQLGHWRSFELHVFDNHRQPMWLCEHPFRFFFQRLTVKDARGVVLGHIQRRMGIFTKAFDVLDAQERVLLEVRSPFWKVWTFRFMREGRELATVEKKWGGFLTEMFTDADRFGVAYDATLDGLSRVLVLMAAIYIDLLYFEVKQSGGVENAIDILTD